MNKRILLVLFTAILLLGAFAVNASAENITVVQEWNIDLGDDIGANFYVKVPEDVADVSVVNVTIADQTETYELSSPNAKGLYKVSVNVAAAQMTENITLQLVVDGTEYEPVSYSIRDYAEHILNGNYSDDIKALVKHMLNYGAAAQTYFGIKTEDPANEGYALDYTAQYPAEYPQMTVAGQIDGVKLYGASLVMDSKVAVRYYFTADSVAGVTFSANGTNYSAVAKNGRFYVEVPGIMPYEYGAPIVLSAVKGEEELAVTYSPLTYFVRMSQKGRDELKALVNAMYGYYEAASTYVNGASVTVTLPTVTGGTVTADQDSYQWGEVVTLTATPDAGYNLKSLAVTKDGQSVDIGGIQLSGGNYSFLAEDGDYTVEAEFAEPIFTVAQGKWDLSNQYNGSVTILSKTADGTTVKTNESDYNAVSVTVKDYTPSKNADGSLKQGDFSMQVTFIFDDGKQYQVRLHNTDADGNYKLQNMGGDNNLTGWKWQADLTAAQKEKLLNGDGVEFAVKLVDSNAELWVDGTKMVTVALGDAYYDKAAQITLCMNGNTNGQNIELPFMLTKAPAPATIEIPTYATGTVTADQTSYKAGDTVTLTVTPAEGYNLKSLTVKKDGQSVDIGNVVFTGGNYSFVAEGGIYTVEAEFAMPIFTATNGDWNLSNQHNGSITILNKTADGTTVKTNASIYNAVSVTVKDYTPSKNADGSLKQGDFSMQVSFIFDDGKQYQVRIHNTDADGNYKLQNMGGDNSLTGWKWQADLTAAQKEKLLNGDGVEFAVNLVGANAELYVDGTLMKTVALSDAYNGKAAQITLCMNGNKNGQDIAIPFELTKDSNAASVVIPAFANGTVTADKTACVVGGEVTLTITPNDGYSQKLYINGEPLLLDWKTNTYSFKVTENAYNITGSFEPSLNAAAKDATRWDSANQAHGVLNSYYPSNDDAWLYEFSGEYQSISAKAKNYLAGADGTGGEGFALNLGFRLSNGKEYIFRIIRQNSKYYHQRFGINGSDWTKKELDDAAIAAICGDGVDFKLERTAADKLTLSVNGVVYDTYTMDGVTEDIWVNTVIIGHYGNKGQKVAIPFALTKVATSDDIQFRSSELSKYVIVYDDGNSDYKELANQLKTQISNKYGVNLSVVSDGKSNQKSYEILLGDTNRYSYQGRVMEYSVTVAKGVFRINVGGSCSAEAAINYLCDKVFNGQALELGTGTHYRNSLLTSSSAITSGTTARIMTANVLADAFKESGSEIKNANYRVEIFAGMLVSYTPDVIGMQEVDTSWSRVLDGYLNKIEKIYGIQYSRYWATYEGKTNYTSLLYRSDKFKVENSGVEVFSWWKDKGANYNYHMRNISWAQFSSLENSSKKFIVANTHWSYREEHADGKTYLTGASKPIAKDELRTQCKDETNRFMTSLKNMYPNCHVFLVGDFNTSLPYFTQWGWKPASFNVISEEAKNNGTALSTVPTEKFFDHILGTGNYTIKTYEFFNNVNEHQKLTDHPFAYADLAIPS